MKTKSETFQAYKIFEAWAKTHKGLRTFKKVRSDRGGEYMDGEFRKYLAAQGTKQILTTHDTPEYNGVTERLNRTLLEKARALLHAAGAPKFLWAEAIHHAVWLKNRTTTRALPKAKTPYEMMYGKKPDLSGLREWGTKVWVHDTSGSKLDGRAKIGRWVGYDEESIGAHRIYWPEKKSISIERNVKFDDNDVLMPSAQPLEGEKEIVKRQSTEENAAETNQDNREISDLQVAEPTGQNLPIPEEPKIDWLGASFNQSEGRPQRTRKPSEYVKRLQAGEGVADDRPSQPSIPKGLQIVEEANIGAAGIEGEYEFEYGMAVAVADAEGMDPLSMEEARRRSDWPKWEEAMRVELEMLRKAGTWGRVERPKGRNVVQCKWVFHIKKDAAGKIERYKARLVAKGFTQIQGIDYYDTFAPVARLASIRTILAVAARNGWPIDMFDFHSAFLNGTLDADEEVFMEQPPGYEDSDSRKYCLKLYKSIYGLKQAGRKWYEVVCRTLADIGFQKSEADPAVFFIHSGNNITILAIHVDDCTITGNSNEIIQDLKVKIESRYSLTDLGPINWLLGIKITRDLEARTLSLSQSSYIKSILGRFNFMDLKPFSTPIDTSIQYSKSQCPQTLEETAEMRQIPYREAIGSLMYCAVATRPDIAFAVSHFTQFMENPGRIHWEGVKRIFRYLSGTRDWRLVYGLGDKGLEGFTDADGSSQEHRHAISGYAFLIDGGAVSWSSKKQELVTLSTTEAEYVAATYAAKEALWLKRLISKVFRSLNEPITLYSDSQSAIALTGDGSYHARTKHIDIRYHFIRFVVQKGSINLIYCPTESMTADILTKALPNTKAKHFAVALGLQST